MSPFVVKVIHFQGPIFYTGVPEKEVEVTHYGGSNKENRRKKPLGRYGYFQAPKSHLAKSTDENISTSIFGICPVWLLAPNIDLTY